MINLTYNQAQKILEAFGGDEETIMQVQSGNGHSGNGLYVGVAGYPEEGSIYLGAEE